ncbi:multicopper oxidase domain-containing protein [Alphaproteobacteria bacterium]|nr:multicopper oxidase domain-containing protein [Alphaproteobacteria bacterium]
MKLLKFNIIKNQQLMASGVVSHNRSLEQVERGLYGPLIVDEHDRPDVDHDEVIVLDDWLFDQQAQIIGDFNAMHSLSHGGRLGNYLSAMTPTRKPLTFRQNDRVRLRLINAATDKVFSLGVHGFDGKVVALDGMPLEAPMPLDHLVLGPAQRADIIADVVTDDGGIATLVSHERSSAMLLAEISVKGKSSRSLRGEVTALPPNPIEKIQNLKDASTASLLMEGGAMGRLQAGVYKGEQLSIRQLVQNGQVWTFNGVANITDEPLVEVSLGEVLRIPITNQTAFSHAMHLHGHHFQEVGSDGSFGPFRDTLLVNPNETREIAFKATNPGSWLFHCHMLSHQKAGMKTFIKVSA